LASAEYPEARRVILQLQSRNDHGMFEQFHKKNEIISAGNIEEPYARVGSNVSENDCRRERGSNPMRAFVVDKLQT
jgi:hypothetical protein